MWKCAPDTMRRGIFMLYLAFGIKYLPFGVAGLDLGPKDFVKCETTAECYIMAEWCQKGCGCQTHATNCLSLIVLSLIVASLINMHFFCWQTLA